MRANRPRAFQLFQRDLTHDLARHAHHYRAGRDPAALRHQGAGGNQAFFTDFAARQQPGADADQRIAAHAFAMDHGGMTHHHPFLDLERLIVVGMHDAGVLHVDPRPQGNAGQVTAHDGGKPDICPRGQDNVTRHHSPTGNVVILDGLHRRCPSA